ncbi:type II secretion system F family protein [Ramlibacter sp. MMS24-I3-19]|uniref:type II secretion system F family protein n=1 Tax=Ramlibacter sp. MMS24-I3-19 TaxID=3416606 RepID=UPI003D03BC98
MFLLGVVVPRFASIIDANGRDIPEASRILMAWGKLVNRHFEAVLAGLAATIVLTAATFARSDVRRWCAGRATSLPLAGPTIRLYRQNQFWQTAAMLVEGGVPAPQAFRSAASLLGASDVRRMHEALSRLDAGQELAESFRASGVVDQVAFRMLQVAQRTGELGRALGQIAAFQAEALERGLDRMTRLVEPLLMVFIGAVIGGIVVLMYLPIFDLASSIQ